MSLEVRWLDRFDDVTDDEYNGLRSRDRNPFLHPAFLRNLESTGCIREDLGWSAHHLAVFRGTSLTAFAPGYIKTNSHGEYVFDHAWAHAYAQYGMDYFPKQLFAVPYSPVSGPRWFACDAESHALLLQTMHDVDGMSSSHVNFLSEPQAAQLPSQTWLERLDVQYHWRRRDEWADFDAFVRDMDHKHRKNIKRERRLVRDAGVSFRVVCGDQITERDMDHAHGFYLQTFAEYGNYPALTREFFQALHREMPENLVLILASLGGETVAGAVCLRSDTTLYGRYWGSHVNVPGLHFETCYYQGIDYCLTNGLTVFEPGAQGVHKIPRGFLPVLTRSKHHVRDPQFQVALRSWCEQSNRVTMRELQELARMSPFKDRAA